MESFLTFPAGRSPAIRQVIRSVVIPDVMVADLSSPDPASYLGVETGGATGGRFGGRALLDDVADLSLGIVFGGTVPALGLAPDDGAEIPALTSDNVDASHKHFLDALPLPRRAFAALSPADRLRRNRRRRASANPYSYGARPPSSGPSRTTNGESKMSAFMALFLIGSAMGQPARAPGDPGATTSGPGWNVPPTIPGRRPRPSTSGPSGPSATARSPQGWSELARAYLARHHQTGSLDDARRRRGPARRAIALGAGSGVQVILGRALLSQHRFPEALEVAERAARGDRIANALLCDVLIELGHLDRARAAFSAYPGTDPLDRIALEARMLEAQGDSDALIGRLRELSDLADRMPQLPAGLAAWYHVRLGHTLIDRGRLSEGRDACRRRPSGSCRGSTPRWSAWPRPRRPRAAGRRRCGSRRRPRAAHRRISRRSTWSPGRQASLGHTARAEEAYARLKSMAQGSPRIYDRLYARACVEAGRDLETALASPRPTWRCGRTPRATRRSRWSSTAWASTTGPGPRSRQPASSPPKILRSGGTPVRSSPGREPSAVQQSATIREDPR